MGIHFITILCFIAATVAACAPSSKPVIRETTSEAAPIQQKATTVTSSDEPVPEGEIPLDDARSKQVDLGIEGTSTGPVIVESGLPATAGQPTETATAPSTDPVEPEGVTETEPGADEPVPPSGVEIQLNDGAQTPVQGQTNGAAEDKKPDNKKKKSERDKVGADTASTVD